MNNKEKTFEEKYGYWVPVFERTTQHDNRLAIIAAIGFIALFLAVILLINHPKTQAATIAPPVLNFQPGTCYPGLRIDSEPQSDAGASAQTVSTIHVSDPVQAIDAVWGSAAPIGLAIARCESRLNPSAINYHNYDGVPDYGLFQLHGNAVMDTYQNTETAYSMYLRRGTEPWNSSRACWGA